MALRNQPYIPLYVQDYLTDEKLNACLPATQGVYIKIMCLFHKCEPYGGILLKQKDKQNESMCLNFALKLANLLPFNLPVIQEAIIELLDEKVLHIDGDFLYQKRMVRDNEISVIRSESGKKGGKNTQSKHKNFAKAKSKAKNEQNPEDEYEDVNENKEEKKKRITKEKKPELIYPFNSEKFMSSWSILISTPKWKKKIAHSLQLALNSLGKYKEEFSVMLVEKAIENGWQGVTYQDTDEQYQKWLNKSAVTKNHFQSEGSQRREAAAELGKMAEKVVQNAVVDLSKV